MQTPIIRVESADPSTAAKDAYVLGYRANGSPIYAMAGGDGAATQFLTPDQVQDVVKAAVAAAIKDINVPDPSQRPAAPAQPAVNVNRNRPHRPSITRVVRALGMQSWKGAELERDICQATADIYAVKDSGDDDRTPGYGTEIPSSFDAYANVLEQAEIRTPASAQPGFKEFVSRNLDRIYGMQEAAVKALAEGTPTASTSGAGAITPIQYLTDQFVLALTSAIVLKNMPEVLTVPVTGPTLELPRESAAASAAVYAENSTITPNDTTLALQEFPIRKLARLQLFSNELLADSNPAIDAVVNRMLARDYALLADTQYLDGAGTGSNIKGIRNYSGLTTSSWTAATNGSTPAADDLINMVFDIYGANANPTAFVMHPRTFKNIVKLKDASGRYLFTSYATWGGPRMQSIPGTNMTYPSKAVGDLNGIPVYLSTQILTNETQGSSNVATHIIYGDFNRCLILERQSINLFMSQHYAMNADQTAIRVTGRTTVALTQPTAFAVATGII